MPDATYQAKVYIGQGAEDLVVASGGEINIESGGALKIAGVDSTTQLAAALAAGAAGRKFVAGVQALDGSNPTPVVTGLSLIIAGGASIISTGLTTDPTQISVNFSTSTAGLDVYAWKPTSTAVTTLVASTSTGVSFSWWGIGT